VIAISINRSYHMSSVENRGPMERTSQGRPVGDSDAPRKVVVAANVRMPMCLNSSLRNGCGLWLPSPRPGSFHQPNCFSLRRKASPHCFTQVETTSSKKPRNSPLNCDITQAKLLLLASVKDLGVSTGLHPAYRLLREYAALRYASLRVLN